MTAGRRRRADEGTVLILVVGLVVVLALVVTVVVDVTSLFLARKDVLATADGAALAGAQSLDAERLYTQGITPGRLPLDPRAAEAAARHYVEDAGLDESMEHVQVQVHATTTTVTVTITGVASLPFVSRVTPGAGGGVRVSGSATAVTAVVRS